MNLIGQYHSSKTAFQQGQFQRSILSCKKILESDISFETKTIIKANLFIAELLLTQKKIDIDEAKNIISLFQGIENKELQITALETFLKNLCLYQISKKKFDSAIQLIENQGIYNNQEINEIYGSIFLCQNQEPPISSPFLTVWHSYLTKDYDQILETVSQLNEEKMIPFLSGFAQFGKKNYIESLRLFELSISKSFRISECLNFAGICCYFLKRMKDSVNYFERSIKMSSSVMSSSLFNLAEVCGVLGRTVEQLSLLQFYNQLQLLAHEGSISTMYLLARTTLENGDYESAASKYSDIYKEIIGRGIDPPSSTFIPEYSFALNMIGQFDLALNILTPDNANTNFEKSVVAHSLFLSENYEDCEKIIDKLEKTPDVLCNKALLSFLSGDDRAALQQIINARRNDPNNERIIRNTVLLNFSRQPTLKAGCIIWLTFLGYQKDHHGEFYQDLIDQMRLSDHQDELTLCVLENWKNLFVNS